ncbi:MAG TPA: CocE/NonD family hydrolase [Caulobacteraceae bacterium]|nr:CocE/NonD family hydrolase [Caulobacteraceae bacterium]
MKRLLAGLGALILGLFLLAVVIVFAAGALYSLTSAPRTPSGLKQVSSAYLTMSDGARIAVDLWLPPDLKRGQRVPVLIKGTPYWRGYQLGFLAKALIELHLMKPLVEPDLPYLARRGYAVLAVDTRGTGASFGSEKVAFDDREIADFREIIDWAARQPWSSGAVGAYGFSYRGILADRMAALRDPNLKAIAPSFDFPDLFLATHPGGVFNRYFMHAWGAQTALLNEGKVPCSGPICHLIVAGPERVEADRSGALLRQALAQHRANYNVEACTRAAPARDDTVCASGKSITDVSPIAQQAEIAAGGAPMYVLVGYFDEVSPLEAVDRFRRLANPQTLVLAPVSHGGFMNTDPYRPAIERADPTLPSQLGREADFFDAYLEHGATPGAKSVRYYVLGEGVWRAAPSWPPPGVAPQNWYLSPEHGLSPALPKDAEARDSYQVDFGASSGSRARYRSPVDLSHTAYPDRANEDRKLIIWQSPPLSGPMEITGDPVAHLTLASDRTDGEVIVYLEDVGPSGAVTYLSEGVLRLAFRARATPAEAALSADPLHGYAARDLKPMEPGQAQPIAIALSPISVMIGRGHRVRIALAGADAANLERIPEGGPETFTIERGARAPSWIELPIRPQP